ENECASPCVKVGPALLGRIIDGFGNPIDGKGPIPLQATRPLEAPPVSPMDRALVREPIGTGVRSIDALLTCGLGQRMGLFAGPGVGKSTLLAWVSKHTSADISVIALIGERGREVREFIENGLGEHGLERCVVVVATAEDSPLLKVRASKLACSVSEYFRDEGNDVLLLMDSLTRLAQAQRQIGLASKEPPATKGFPPSVFSLLPDILERAGSTTRGSITGFYTVLVEGDDFNEPIPDAVKGITDGHIWLDRKLAERGHYPAIDVLRSISRVRGDVSDKEQVNAAQHVQKLVGNYDEIEDLVQIGAYVPGASMESDVAVMSRERVTSFLRQSPDRPTTLASARKQLFDLKQEIDATQQVAAAQLTQGSMAGQQPQQGGMPGMQQPMQNIRRSV
ncbi:MAG: FliI/YscN family ATPase, partial [Planctomycetota bacterium]